MMFISIIDCTTQSAITKHGLLLGSALYAICLMDNLKFSYFVNLIFRMDFGSKSTLLGILFDAKGLVK